MWYLVFTRNVKGKESELKDSTAAHRQWLEDQHRGGRLLFSGPTTDRGGGGLRLLRDSLGERPPPRRPGSGGSIACGEAGCCPPARQRGGGAALTSCAQIVGRKPRRPRPLS